MSRIQIIVAAFVGAAVLTVTGFVVFSGGDGDVDDAAAPVEGGADDDGTSDAERRPGPGPGPGPDAAAPATDDADADTGTGNEIVAAPPTTVPRSRADADQTRVGPSPTIPVAPVQDSSTGGPNARPAPTPAPTVPTAPPPTAPAPTSPPATDAPSPETTTAPPRPTPTTTTTTAAPRRPSPTTTRPPPTTTPTTPPPTAAPTTTTTTAPPGSGSPLVVIANVDDGDTVDTSTYGSFYLSGTVTDPGGTAPEVVTVSTQDPGVVPVVVPVDGNGGWVAEVLWFADAAVTATVTATDADGNAGSDTVELDVSAPAADVTLVDPDLVELTDDECGAVTTVSDYFDGERTITFSTVPELFAGDVIVCYADPASSGPAADGLTAIVADPSTAGAAGDVTVTEAAITDALRRVELAGVTGPATLATDEQIVLPEGVHTTFAAAMVTTSAAEDESVVNVPVDLGSSTFNASVGQDYKISANVTMDRSATLDLDLLVDASKGVVQSRVAGTLSAAFDGQVAFSANIPQSSEVELIDDMEIKARLPLPAGFSLEPYISPLVRLQGSAGMKFAFSCTLEATVYMAAGTEEENTDVTAGVRDCGDTDGAVYGSGKFDVGVEVGLRLKWAELVGPVVKLETFMNTYANFENNHVAAGVKMVASVDGSLEFGKKIFGVNLTYTWNLFKKSWALDESDGLPYWGRPSPMPGPDGLEATVDGRFAALTWDRSDHSVDGYRIFLNGTQVGSVSPATTTFDLGDIGYGVQDVAVAAFVDTFDGFEEGDHATAQARVVYDGAIEGVLANYSATTTPDDMSALEDNRLVAVWDSPLTADEVEEWKLEAFPRSTNALLTAPEWARFDTAHDGNGRFSMPILVEEAYANYALAVTGYDANGRAVTDTITSTSITALLLPRLTLDPAGMPEVTVGVPFHADLAPRFGIERDGTYYVYPVSGTLPLGLSVSEAGVISGTPVDDTGGVVSFEVYDADGLGATYEYTLGRPASAMPLPVVFGSNMFGQLGDGTTLDRTSPLALRSAGSLAGKKIVDVSLSNHGLAVASDGTVHAWGNNYSGETTVDGLVAVLSPVDITHVGSLAGRDIVSVVTGPGWSMAVASDGTLHTWGGAGRNAHRLGDGTAVDRSTPTLVKAGSLARKHIVKVVASDSGWGSAMAQASDGSLHVWGWNNGAELADGTTTDRPIPVEVTSSGSFAGKTIVDFDMALQGGIALASDGSVHTWGGNDSGQRGAPAPYAYVWRPNTITSSGSLAGETVVDVESHSLGNFVIDADGDVHAWGHNQWGALGDGTTTHYRTLPVKISGVGSLAGKEITSISSESSHTIALASDGSVHTWGHSRSGLLGDGTAGEWSTVRNRAVQINGYGSLPGSSVVRVIGGGSTTGAIDSTGRLHLWGGNGSGSLGDGTLRNRLVPGVATGLGSLEGKKAAIVDTAPGRTYAIATDGTLHGWGAAQGATLGDGGTIDRHSPVAIDGGSLAGKKVVAVAARAAGGVAVADDGTVHAWGQNSFGAVGDATTADRTLPVEITGSGSLAGKKLMMVRAMSNHVLALADDGTVHAWGDNGSGQLGNDGWQPELVPVEVTVHGSLAGKRVVAFDSSDHSLALADDGTLHAWGPNFSGQLGDGTTEAAYVPVDVTASGSLAGKQVAQFRAGLAFSMALATDGTLHVWGEGDGGRLGTGDSDNQLVPVEITGAGSLEGRTVETFDAAAHAIVITTDGAIHSWGMSTFGESGTGRTGAEMAPVLIGGNGSLQGTRPRSVSASGTHTVVIADT